jgi:hypothetical protein
MSVYYLEIREVMDINEERKLMEQKKKQDEGGQSMEGVGRASAILSIPKARMRPAGGITN